MSRSRRKPFIKDGYGSRWKRQAKRYSNKKIRRKLSRQDYQLSDGMAYKNGPGLNRWDICDYSFYVDRPVRGGRYLRFGFWESEGEMKKHHRKAVCK